MQHEPRVRMIGIDPFTTPDGHTVDVGVVYQAECVCGWRSGCKHVTERGAERGWERHAAAFETRAAA